MERRRKAMWLYPKVVGFNPPERWGHSACFFEGVVYVFGGSGEETRRGAETVRNIRKDARRPCNCNCNSSCTSREVPPRLLCLASGPHGHLECSRLLLHLKGGLRLFNFGDMNTAERWGNDDVNEIYALESRALIGLLIHTPSTQEQSYIGFPKKWPMDISLEDLLYIHDAKAATSLLEDKTIVSGEVDCVKAMKGCVASFPMLLLVVDEKTSIYNDSILNVALSTKDASTHDCSERREALLFGCRTLPPLLNNAAKVGDATKSDSVLVSIFVRPVSGEPLVLTVNLDESSQHMMCLYAQKTNTKLELQYFIYGRKRLEPDSTLLSYGVKANSTIHACTWLLGGAVSMSNYLAVTANKEKLLIEVTLPNGKLSLEMTKIGCLFLSTWLKCFTRAFANSKSWNGNFTMDHFKVVHGHVLVMNGADANVRLDSSSMKADMARLVQYIMATFSRNNPNLVSKFPPYMESLITFLRSRRSPMLYNADRLFIETHVCCVESAARGVLLAMVQRKFKSLSLARQEEWIGAMQSIDKDKSYASADNLSTAAVFQDIITEAKTRGQPYGSSKPSIFRLMRDNFVHGPSHRFDKSSKPWKEKFKNDDGIELMIPAVNKDFLPEIIYTMIKDNKVDIEAELHEAQVRCTCHICYPSHSGSKGGGESSTVGKGKQPESPGSSQPSTPSSRQGSNVGPVRPPSAWQQPQTAARLGFPQPSMTSSRPGSYLVGTGRPSSWQQPQAPAAPRPRPPPPAPTQQESSSSEFGWQTARRKGKGKRYD